MAKWKDHDKYINKDGTLRRHAPISRHELEKLTQAYLDSGGKIKKCPPGRTSRGIKLKPRYYLDMLDSSPEYHAYLGGDGPCGWATNFGWADDDSEDSAESYSEDDVLEDDYSEESFA